MAATITWGQFLQRGRIRDLIEVEDDHVGVEAFICIFTI